jgi:phosphoglycolate phosphatase-like HAD superfamily hydrolase
MGVGDGLGEVLGEVADGPVGILTRGDDAGRPVVIVSNNAPGPITEFLDRFHLQRLVDAVIGRAPGRPDLMKPDPHMIKEALTLLDQPADRCGFVGDSVTDIEVARRTGVRSIGYAKHLRRGEELEVAGADALVTHMNDLAVAIRSDTLQRT